VAGRTALVVGGSRGIGRAVALALAGAGADVLAAGRSAAALRSLRAVASARGWPLRIARGDAAAPARARAMVRRAARGAAAPDLLVHAPGDYWEGPLARLTPARWEALSRSNVSTALAVIGAALPGMRRRRYGRIVLFGVAGGDVPRSAPRVHAYRAAKLALLTLARAFAHEEAARGITVNVILPGRIRTGSRGARAAGSARSIPAGRPGAPSEVARTALFLLAEESGYITGAAIPVSGGYLI
jgi:NAD(P)-dependent dehydrogenase (short-subunit alcohol dehydrogenase family)